MPLRCGENKLRGWVRRQADATIPVVAYELAEKAARRDARRLVEDWVARQRCPEGKGCDRLTFDRSSLSISARRVWGAPSPDRPGYYRIVVQADYRFTVRCDEAPPPEPEELPPLPPEETTGPTTSTSTGDGGTTPPPTPPAGPCTVTVRMADASSRSGPGVFDWGLDVTFTATASDPSHTWPPTGCRVTQMNYSAGGEPASWAMAKTLGLTTDLTTGYGLTITPGAGTATITGTLFAGKNGIAPMPGCRIQVVVSAVDSAGDGDDFTFVLAPPP